MQMCQNNEEFLFQVFCCTENTIEPLFFFFAQSKNFLTKKCTEAILGKKKAGLFHLTSKAKHLQ